MAQLFDEALAYAKKKREEKNVSHAHNVEERTVLNNFSQTMKPGVKTTLITKENECQTQMIQTKELDLKTMIYIFIGINGLVILKVKTDKEPFI